MSTVTLADGYEVDIDDGNDHGKEAVSSFTVPGVTGILQVIAKPALVTWSKGEVARFAAEHIDLIASMVETSGDTKDVARWIASGPDRTRDKAGVVGTNVHAICAAIAMNEPFVSLRAPELPYVEGFQHWLDERQPTVLMAEGMGVNLSVGYGGTFDLILEMDGHRWLCDLKTSKNIYPETAMQLAAYAKLEWLATPPDLERSQRHDYTWTEGGEKLPMPVCSKFAVIHLTPERASFVEYLPTAATWQAFQGAVSIHRWMAGEALTVMKGGRKA